jgi:hypothetical protein
MPIPRLAPLFIAFGLVACQRGPVARTGGSPTPQSPTTSSTGPVSPLPASPLDLLPAPDEPIPTDSKELAAQLTTTGDELDAAIDGWVEGGDPANGEPPQDVVLLALYQQRMYRYLVRHSGLADRTISALPKPAASEAQDIVTAGHELYSLLHPVKSATTFKVQPPEPVGVLLDYFRMAERRFHVSWEVLAAVNYIESKFGRVKSASYAGAQGPMQFLPSTWQRYGMGGDIHDPHDAIMGAANYLHASGAPGDYRTALYHYNPSWAYVDAILLYARRMTKDARAYYAFYNWQVFVATTSGDKRLTGPGL